MDETPRSEPSAAADAAVVERARLRGKRMAHVVVVTVAVLFIGSSAWQIIGAVFGVAPTTVIRSWAAASPDARECAAGLRFLTATDRGDVARAPAPSPADRADVTEPVREACARSADGLDAWASFARLRSAERQVSERARSELEPLRQDLAAHLPVELR